TCSKPLHVCLDEARRKLGYARAGVVLIRMHRLFWTQHRCRRCLSGAQQGWPFRFPDRKVQQRDTTPFCFGTPGPDGLEDILAPLWQSRSSHGPQPPSCYLVARRPLPPVAPPYPVLGTLSSG